MGNTDSSSYTEKELFRLTSEGNYRGLVRLLGAHPELDVSVDDNRALIQAITGGYLEMVRFLLLDSRINPNLPEYSPPLVVASAFGRKDIVQLLLSDKRLFFPTEQERMSPRTIANTSYSHAIMCAIDYGHFEVVKLLLEHKYLLPQKVVLTLTAHILQIAKKKGNPDILNLVTSIVY